MLEGKGVVESSDMPEKMQSHAMHCASQALDLHDVSDCTNIARHIKKEFDSFYGDGWQEMDGSALWGFTLAVFSLMQKAVSFISAWKR